MAYPYISHSKETLESFLLEIYDLIKHLKVIRDSTCATFNFIGSYHKKAWGDKQALRGSVTPKSLKGLQVVSRWEWGKELGGHGTATGKKQGNNIKRRGKSGEQFGPQCRRVIYRFGVKL